MKDLPTVSLYQVFRNRKRILENPLPFHNENFRKFGDSFRVNVGPGKSVVFTRNPGLIKHLLQKQHKSYHKSPLQTVDLAKYIGHGILTSNGDHWLTHRRMVQPAFHKKKLEKLISSMEEAIKLELMKIHVDNTMDVFPLMGDLAFQVVAKTLFSREDIQEDMAVLKHITNSNQEMLIREMRQPYLKWWFRLSGQIAKHISQSDDARKLLNKIIEDRVASSLVKDDLLDMLLSARYEDGTPMSRKQLIDEVLILFTAGYETTANALSFALYFLARHPQIQQKAYEEILTVLNEGPIDMDGISRMQYVANCIEEAMRLYPPAYYIDRIAIEDDEFEGSAIAKGTMILMSMYEIHRYADFWKQPDDFIPERYARIPKKELSEYYFPFGAGPRMCVGNNFAMYEMIITVAQLLKKFHITTEKNKVEINPLISLKPKEVPLKFSRRNVN
ncbi:MAG: cytochrome P450 [Eudoraea sp.]|nr:cytochrome P450 [Eudoraea sp.]